MLALQQCEEIMINVDPLRIGGSKMVAWVINAYESNGGERQRWRS